SPQQTGAYECEIYVSDARGSVWQSAPALAVVLDPQRLILIPPGVSVIEESAFAGTDACALALPESVQVVQAGAFSNASLNVVFIESASTRIDETAFDSDVVLCYDYAAFRRWLLARAQGD
ncbi:MAG: leucine-rich repeat protein, partial [Clostridia bacterium]|nr:leucine-rich repeat protein [Clostridia bacterium]